TAYQERAPQTAFDFPAGSAWVVFTDAVSHAAMAGQYQLEQTFLLPVDAMADPASSPLRALERLRGRALISVSYRSIVAVTSTVTCRSDTGSAASEITSGLPLSRISTSDCRMSVRMRASPVCV